MLYAIMVADQSFIQRCSKTISYFTHPSSY
jgi:hypothetical protein